MIKVTKDQARRLVMLADELSDGLEPTDENYPVVDGIHTRRAEALDRLRACCYQNAAAIAADVISRTVTFMYQHKGADE